MACPPVTSGGAFLSSVLHHVDCQGETLGSAGYQLLAGPGSPFAALLTVLLTLFVAAFGLRMVLGQTPTLPGIVMAAVKIGVVLVLATSWPAYRTLVYDVVVDGPGEIAHALGGAAGLPGSQGDLVARLQTADIAIARLTTLGSGRNDLQAALPRSSSGMPTVQPERAPITDDMAFGTGRVVLLSAVIGALALVKLGAGILLALAPLFAGLLLFEVARGLLFGWLRALVFILLGSIATSLVLGVCLAVLEPWLTEALRLRGANIVVPDAPIELLVISLAFAAALLGSLLLVGWLCFFSHFAVRQHVEHTTPPQARNTSPTPRSLGALQLHEAPGRVRAIADAIALAGRHEAAAAAIGGRAIQIKGNVDPASRPAARPSPGSGRSRRLPRGTLASTLRDRQS